MALVFVNTRSQAELIFQELWRINSEGHAIALHHGSLDATQRRKVEAAMAAGRLRAVVCTSTLDLGIDWGDVDLVVHVGAPKGASRLAQRIGRANHRMDEPSNALLVPANRFEVMECRAALDANYLGAQDTPPIRPGGLDVLAQHVLGMACSAPFSADALYGEVTSAFPYRALARATFDRVVAFVATGGYALKTYERFAKIREGKDGLWRITHPRVAQQYRLNVGTIVETALLNVRVSRNRGAGFAGRGGRVLGKIEEYFIETLSPGDTFLFAGLILRFEGIHENEVVATRTADDTPKIPVYSGGKFPLSTFLAAGVRAILADPEKWTALPDQVADWLRIQRDRSVLPRTDQLLVETFPRGNRFYMVAYPFEGRLAHQTLGMLLTRRLDRAKLRPTGFVATDYSIAVWGLADLGRAFSRREPSLAAALRRGHARRRPRGVDGRELSPQAHVPQLRPHLRPHREAPPRPGEDRPPGHHLHRPRLRRAPQARARPRPHAGRLGRRRHRPARHRPPRRYAREESRAAFSTSASTVFRRSPCR